MVLSNQNLNTFLNHLAIKHNIDLPKEMSEFVVDKNPETNKEKIQFVFMAVSSISGIGVSHLLGKCRKREYIDWKHLARYICIMNGFGTLQSLGRELMTDHSTLISSRNLVNELLDIKDKPFLNKFNQVKHLLK